jgi:hypothetical protein
VGTAEEAWSAVVVLARAKEAAAAVSASISMLGVWAREAGRPSERGKMRPCVSIALARGKQEGIAVGRADCPGQRILGINLRLKWVRADSSKHRFLFETHHWADFVKCALSV